MFLEFCAGIAFFTSLGVALQLRLMPYPARIIGLSCLAVLLTIIALALTFTDLGTQSSLTWVVLSTWLAVQVSAQVARRKWHRQLFRPALDSRA